MIFSETREAEQRRLKGQINQLFSYFFKINIYIRVREIVPMFAVALQSHIVLVTNKSLPYG